jgi:hypothetical protein
MKNDPQAFAYWLQGFVELNGELPTQAQWDSIVKHLNLVFDKITPEVKTDYSIEQIIKGEDPNIPAFSNTEWMEYYKKLSPWKDTKSMEIFC